MKRLLDYQADTGVAVFHEYDPVTDETTISSVQSASAIEAIVERNKTLQNEEKYSKDGIKNDWWHYASIPVGVQMEWKQKYGIDIFHADTKQLMKLLNDPEYKYLKVTTGKHVAR